MRTEIKVATSAVALVVEQANTPRCHSDGLQKHAGKVDKGMVHSERINLLVHSSYTLLTLVASPMDVPSMQEIMLVRRPTSDWKGPTLCVLKLDKMDISKTATGK